MKLVLFSGRICSGKSTEAKKYAELIGAEFIEVSSIVKDILQTNRRENLQGHPELDDQIVKEIVAKNPFKISGTIVISGVRQLSIIQKLLKYYEISGRSVLDLQVIWIDVNTEERKRRYSFRAADKDNQLDFNTAEQNDDKLGLKELEEYIYSSYSFQRAELDTPFKISIVRN